MHSNSFTRNIVIGGIFFILVLPLLHLQPWFSPPAWAGTMLMRVILSISLLSLAGLLLFQKNRVLSIPTISSLRSHPAFWPISLFLLYYISLLISTIFSLDPAFSFWGDAERSWGTLNFSFYVLFAFLAFLFLKKHNWQKVWWTAIGVGFLVALIGIFQGFGQFENILHARDRAASTIGNPVFFGIYLLVLSIMFAGLISQVRKKVSKLFLSIPLSLFFFAIIFISLTRSAYVGLAAGALFFLFFLPNASKHFRFVLVGGILVVLTVGAYINITPAPSFVSGNPQMISVWNRVQADRVLNSDRFFVWNNLIQAIDDRPLLGYGPYNASIPFDTYFIPTNSFYSIEGISLWWDSTHNMFLDILLENGIASFLLFLGFVATLFWGLHKTRKERPDLALRVHTSQAALIGYLAAMVFAFNTFATYLLFFLLIAYSLHLISQREKRGNSLLEKESVLSFRIHPAARIGLGILSMLLLSVFIYQFNIQPFSTNREVNTALLLNQNMECREALTHLEPLDADSSFLTHYINRKYVSVLAGCIQQHPEETLQFSQRAKILLLESAELRPLYTRTWLLLAGYTNSILARADGEEETKLRDEVNYYIAKAEELSPQRSEILSERSRVFLMVDEYETAKSIALECLAVSELQQSCWELKVKSNIFLENFVEAQEDFDKLAPAALIDIAIFYDQKAKLTNESIYYERLASIYEIVIEKSRPSDSDINFAAYHKNLATVYIQLERYDELPLVYESIIQLADPKDPKLFQYYELLADSYRRVGQTEKARQAAYKVLELDPSSKEAVEEFLESL